MGNFGQLEVKIENLSRTALYANISAIPTYYIVDNIAVDLELSYLASESSRPGMSVIGNLSYTYPLGDSILAPFARAGYGIGNSLSSYVGPYARPEILFSDFDVSIINLGLGVKYLLSPSVNIRSELNYRLTSTKIEGIDFKVNNLALWMGLALNL